MSFLRRFFCLVLPFVTFSILANAQIADEVQKVLKKKRSIYFNWDSKATFISNNYAQVKSVKLGFDFGGKTKVGLGYNWYKGDLNFVPDLEKPTINYNLKMRYGSFFLEHMYFENKRWEASIPVQFGVGWLNYQNANKEVYDKAGGLVLYYEPSSSILYKFWRYFGAGGGIGYRIAFLTGPNPNEEKLHSPVFFIRTKVYFDVVWKDIKKLF